MNSTTKITDGLAKANITAKQCKQYAKEMQEHTDVDLSRVYWDVIANILNERVERYLKERQG